MLPTTDKLTPRSNFVWQSLKTIPAHATNVSTGLVKTKRLARKIIGGQDTFNSKGLTTNYVFPIKDSDKVLGYLKIGRNGEEGSALMEKFAWNCSIFFGVSDFFTATEKFKISSDKVQKFSVDIEDRDTEKIRRYSLGDLSDINSPRGSFQMAENGTLLEDFIDDGFSITDCIPNKTEAMKMLIRATLITLTFGMYDAHSANIIIDKNGQIKFFDNARIFPHSNGTSCYGDKLAPAYRSGLLELDESYETLTNDDLNFLKEEFKEQKLKFSQFKEFLAQEDTEEMLEDLPLGWFNQEDALNSTQERFDRLEQALLNPKINTLAGFVEASIPYFRFLAIAQSINRILCDKDLRILIIYEEDLREVWKEGMVYGAVATIEDSLAETSSLGINLEELLTLCNQDISYLELINEVIPLFDKPKGLVNSYVPIRKKLYDHSEIDLKDIPTNAIYSFIDAYIGKYLKLEKFPINRSNRPYTLKVELYGGWNEPSSYTLIYVNARNEKVTKDLSVYEKPGLITLKYIGEKLSMTVPEFCHWVRMKCVE